MDKAYFESPLGILEISASDKGVSKLTFSKKKEQGARNKILEQATQELKAYFSGKLKQFSIPLDLSTGTEFQQKVWKALLEIPYGMTRSYLDIARILEDEKAVRAVGMANGQNPIMIIVPCHRVIGSDGSLTGYAHGIEIKRQLLALENPRNFAINGTLF